MKDITCVDDIWNSGEQDFQLMVGEISTYTDGGRRVGNGCQQSFRQVAGTPRKRCGYYPPRTMTWFLCHRKRRTGFRLPKCKYLRTSLLATT